MLECIGRSKTCVNNSLDGASNKTASTTDMENMHMRIILICLLAVALAAPGVAMAQTKEAKPGLQLVLGEDKAVSGIQYKVFVFKLLDGKSSPNRALLVNAKTASDAKKKLAAATGKPETAFASLEAGVLVKPGGPTKRVNGFIGLEQDGIHMATYSSVMKCDVDIRKDCTGNASTLGATVSEVLTDAEVKAAVGSATPSTTKMRKGRAKKRPVAPDPR